MIYNPRISLLAAAISLTWCAATANAGVIIDLNDELGGTRVSISGSLDTSGLSFAGSVPSSFLNMQDNTELWFSGGPGNYTGASHGQTVANWHALDVTGLSFSDVTGTDFGFNQFNVNLPVGYVSGNSISSRFLIDGLSLTDINPQAGVVLTLGNGDTVTVNSASSVPEPSSFVLFSVLGIVLLVRRLSSVGCVKHSDDEKVGRRSSPLSVVL
jgi:hypothetical protein